MSSLMVTILSRTLCGIGSREAYGAVAELAPWEEINTHGASGDTALWGSEGRGTLACFRKRRRRCALPAHSI